MGQRWQLKLSRNGDQSGGGELIGKMVCVTVLMTKDKDGRR